jgi:large subunit ribosomal protein L32
MPVPKRKRSRARRDKRFANKGMKIKAIVACKNCAAPLVPHVLCGSCGYYKGVKVMATKDERASKRAELKSTLEAKRAARAPKTIQE